MIVIGTFLKVTDNSGARFAQCIKVYGSNNMRFAKAGAIILVTIKRAIPKEKQINKINKRKKIIKGSIYRAVIVRTRRQIRRDNGDSISFKDNAVVLLKDKENLLCTRVFGPVSFELRRLGFSKVISLSAGLF
jgi:large subunit ribosomal protein L14